MSFYSSQSCTDILGAQFQLSDKHCTSKPYIQATLHPKVLQEFILLFASQPQVTTHIYRNSNKNTQDCYICGPVQETYKDPLISLECDLFEVLYHRLKWPL